MRAFWFLVVPWGGNVAGQPADLVHPGSCGFISRFRTCLSPIFSCSWDWFRWWSATALEPQRANDSRFRSFGLLDLSILILYSLYLFAFFVYAYRLLPGAMGTYNHNFNVADSIGNQLFAVATGLRFSENAARGVRCTAFSFSRPRLSHWPPTLINVAIDLGGYYTGSLYDVPLIGSTERVRLRVPGGASASVKPAPEKGEREPGRQRSIRGLTFLSSNLAMLVTLSTPAIGLWLLTDLRPATTRLFSFRLDITLLTIFLLTLLLSIKQDFLSANLFGSLRHLSNTYSSIERFKDHLVQGDKLASLGELVASVAEQIRKAMTVIRQQASLITSRSQWESRSRSLAGKIGQYAERTDALVENMQRFAQETPLRLAPVEVKPLLESALHLSRIDKLQERSGAVGGRARVSASAGRFQPVACTCFFRLFRTRWMHWKRLAVAS